MAVADELKRVPLFSGLSQRQLKQLAKDFHERKVKPGTELIKQGEMSGIDCFVIAEGEAAVKVDGVEVDRLGPGDYFGDIAMIDQGDRTASIEAVSDLECYGLTFWDFRPLIESDARIAWPLLQAMAKRLRAAVADA